MKITRRQLRRLIREQFRSRQSTYEAPRREFDEGQKLPLKDKGTGISSGEGMEREMVIETMKLIQKWRNLTRKHDLTDRHGEATFDSYVDSAFKTVQGKIYNNDYSVPYDLPGLSEMKINKTDLKRIIKEEISKLSEMRRPPLDPEGYDYDAMWQGRPAYEGGEDRGLAASEYTLPPPPKPPANWRPGQRVSWNRLASHPEHGHLAVPDNYEFFLKAHDKLLADYSKDSKDPDQMASALSMIALEAQDLGPSASQPATTGFPDLDAKLRGLPPGHVDLSQLSESRIDLGRWNKMAGTLLCEADYHDFGIPVPAEELRHRSMLPSEEVQATHFSDHPGNLSLMDWANKAAHTLGLPRAESLPNFIDPMTGNAILSPVDEHRMGTSPEEYAEKVRAHERSLFDMGRM